MKRYHAGRTGVWGCKCGVTLRHSLDVWEHLGLLHPVVATGHARPTPCDKGDIIFDCKAHGAEHP